jgi:hypothetical protein
MHPEPRNKDRHFHWSEAVWWAWEELNLRLHPERKIARVVTGLCRTKES